LDSVVKAGLIRSVQTIENFFLSSGNPDIFILMVESVHKRLELPLLQIAIANNDTNVVKKIAKHVKIASQQLSIIDYASKYTGDNIIKYLKEAGFKSKNFTMDCALI
jgi:hypothetical protein